MHEDKKEIKLLRVDGGSEFKGATTEMLKRLNIELQKSEPFAHMRLARTDRVHRVVREKLGAFFEISKGDRWVDALQDIIKNINDTPHVTMSNILKKKVTPATVTSKQEQIIRTFELSQAKALQDENDELQSTGEIQYGRTRCRLLTSKTKAGIMDKFAKSHRNTWTRDTFIILTRNGVNSWVIDVPAGEVSIWPTHSIQILSNDESDRISSAEVDDQLANKVKDTSKRVNQKAARAARMEERNISEAEQAAALAAPSRPKRTTRVDYKALITS
jgi:hypothetical protein